MLSLRINSKCITTQLQSIRIRTIRDSRGTALAVLRRPEDRGTLEVCAVELDAPITITTQSRLSLEATRLHHRIHSTFHSPSLFHPSIYHSPNSRPTPGPPRSQIRKPEEIKLNTRLDLVSPIRILQFFIWIISPYILHPFLGLLKPKTPFPPYTLRIPAYIHGNTTPPAPPAQRPARRPKDRHQQERSMSSLPPPQEALRARTSAPPMHQLPPRGPELSAQGCSAEVPYLPRDAINWPRSA